MGHMNVINSPGQNAEKHVETDYNYTMEVPCEACKREFN